MCIRNLPKSLSKFTQPAMPKPVQKVSHSLMSFLKIVIKTNLGWIRGWGNVVLFLVIGIILFVPLFFLSIMVKETEDFSFIDSSVVWVSLCFHESRAFPFFQRKERL